jgi:hypothetical protein
MGMSKLTKKPIQVQAISNRNTIQIFPNAIKTGEKIFLEIPSLKNELTKANMADVTGRRSLTNMRFDRN